jgi:hypothetical protein
LPVVLFENVNPKSTRASIATWAKARTSAFTRVVDALWHQRVHARLRRAMAHVFLFGFYP